MLFPSFGRVQRVRNLSECSVRTDHMTYYIAHDRDSGTPNADQYGVVPWTLSPAVMLNMLKRTRSRPVSSFIPFLFSPRS
jgi:hypothetical protein